jgi:hypothetical protein
MFFSSFRESFNSAKNVLASIPGPAKCEFPAIHRDITAGHWWLTSVILATWETEVNQEGCSLGGQPGQIVLEMPSPK